MIIVPSNVGKQIVKGSTYFPATNFYTDYLTVASSSAWAFSGDMTQEAWINLTTGNRLHNIFSTGAAGSLDQFFAIPGSSGSIYWGGSYSSTLNIQFNTWHHVAVSRSGTTTKFFFNGTLAGTSTISGTIGQNVTAYIGMRGDPDSQLAGYISNLRISNAALYAASFTVPTQPLDALSSTLLLTCNSPTSISDVSSNNRTVTAYGYAQASSFSPFQ